MKYEYTIIFWELPLSLAGAFFRLCLFANTFVEHRQGVVEEEKKLNGKNIKYVAKLRSRLRNNTLERV